MQQDNNFIFVDENPDIKYRDIGTQYHFLPNGIMRYTACFPDATYMIAPLYPDDPVKNILANLQGFCELGHEIESSPYYYHMPQSGRVDFSTPFDRHYALGVRDINPPCNFNEYPNLVFGMNIDFNSGYDLRRIANDVSLNQVEKIKRICFTNEEINQLQKPSRFKHLQENVTQVAAMFAYGFCCNQNPIMNGAYERYKVSTNCQGRSFADELIFYQNLILRKKIPFFGLENKIPLLVNTAVPTNDESGKCFELVQDIAEMSSVIFSKAPIVPTKSIIGLLNGIQLSAFNSHTQSSLGQNDPEQESWHGYSVTELRSLNMAIAAFRKNYNFTHPSRTGQASSRIYSLPRATA